MIRMMIDYSLFLMEDVEFVTRTGTACVDEKTLSVVTPSHLFRWSTMSGFFGGSTPQPQGPDPVFAAKTEMEMYTGMI